MEKKLPRSVVKSIDRICAKSKIKKSSLIKIAKDILYGNSPKMKNLRRAVERVERAAQNALRRRKPSRR